MSAERIVNGVTNTRAARLGKQATRELARSQRDDAERVERVCAALRDAPGMSDDFRAQIAKTILTHPVHLFGSEVP
ncbi:hypothetical protein ABQE57_24760 [Mycolicibacterium elephantis]